MRQKAYFLAKIGADTAENKRNFAEIRRKLETTLRGRDGAACVARRAGGGGGGPGGAEGAEAARRARSYVG